MTQLVQESKFDQRTLRGEIPTSSCLVDLTAESWENSRWKRVVGCTSKQNSAWE